MKALRNIVRIVTGCSGETLSLFLEYRDNRDNRGMGRSREICGFAAACVLVLAANACAGVGSSGQENLDQEMPLPSVEPSPEVTGAYPAGPSECKETVRPNGSPESIAPSSGSATAFSCGGRSVTLTEEQMRSASPAPMPLQIGPNSTGNSSDSQVSTPQQGGAARLDPWTYEKCFSSTDAQGSLASA